MGADGAGVARRAVTSRGGWRCCDVPGHALELFAEQGFQLHRSKRGKALAVGTGIPSGGALAAGGPPAASTAGGQVQDTLGG